MADLLERKAGFFVDPQEDWTADAQEPKEFSQQRVEGCDLCILLVAFRRGCVPEQGTQSITQLEYKFALDHGMDVLVFMLDDDEPWPRRFDEMQTDPCIGAWRAELRERHGVDTLSTEVLTPHASAILLDPEWGLPASRKRAKNAGLLLAYEKTGYDKTGPGRLPVEGQRPRASSPV